MPRAANVGWHQDQQYWSHWEDGSELFTVWIAMSHVTLDAGPMKFVRGSHQWGFLNQGSFYSSDLQSLRDGIRVPEGKVWEEVPAILAPGR